jgi:hypothetical protein
MAFKRTKEDFVCEHCGASMKGNGFTDHCSQCLWSKHVDVDPGDRASSCGGLMEPVDTETKKGEFRVLQKCNICGFSRWSPIVSEDSMSEYIVVTQRAAERKSKLLR